MEHIREIISRLADGKPVYLLNAGYEWLRVYKRDDEMLYRVCMSKADERGFLTSEMLVHHLSMNEWEIPAEETPEQRRAEKEWYWGVAKVRAAEWERMRVKYEQGPAERNLFQEEFDRLRDLTRV